MELVEGDELQLEVRATGRPPLSYQWSRAGNPLRTQSTPRLRIEECVLKDGGIYICQVSNPWCAIGFHNLHGLSVSYVINDLVMSLTFTVCTFLGLHRRCREGSMSSIEVANDQHMPSEHYDTRRMS